MVSGDYPERSLISANLDPWRKMAEMEAGGRGLYHMAQEAVLPVWKVSKKMIDTPAEVPKPRRVKGFETQGAKDMADLSSECPHCC